jgi:hypothetical protein
MVRKLFIVDRGNERLYAALRSALASEPDVEIFYDRRTSAASVHWHGEERRVVSVLDRIREDGFAVVRPGPPPPRARNIRWA